MDFITRIRTNMRMVRACFSFMWQRKIFLLIPVLKVAILSGVTIPLGYTFIASLGVYARQYHASPLAKTDILKFPGSLTIHAITILVFLMIIILTLFLFNILALTVTHLTLYALEGKEVSFAHATKKSFSRITTVALWSVVQLGVAAVLSLSRSKGRGGGQSGMRRVVSNVLGASWHVVTFFMYPVLATENLKVRNSLQRSYQLFKEKFGDVIIVVTAFNLMSIVPLLLLFFFYRLFPRFAFFGFDIRVIWASVVAMLFFSLLITTAKTIFKTALYCFATGRSTGSFSRSDLHAQIIKK